MLIEFFGDITCPWSHLGWRRLRRALNDKGHDQVFPLWQPYQLAPYLPPNGMPRNEFLLHKFKTARRVRDALKAVDFVMRQDGLYVDLGRIQTMPNTAAAHLLVLCGQDEGLTDALIDELFVAFFVKGLSLTDTAILREIGQKAGFSKAALALFDASAAEASQKLKPFSDRAKRLQLHAVPYTLFNKKYCLAGAHDPVAFGPLIDATCLET